LIDLTIGNLVAYSAQVLVVVAAGAAAARVIRMPAARVRLVYWRAIAAVCLLLPLLPPPGDVVLIDAVATPPAMIETAADAGVAARDVPQSRFFPAAMAGWLLLAGAGARAVWLTIGLLALTRLRKESRPATLAEDIDVLRRGVASHAAVRWHDGVEQPVTFGLRHPVVLLPRHLNDLPFEAQRAVVCHELLHVRRRDWAWMLGEEAVRCVFWFHPAMRYALTQLQLSREQVIDEEVVRITAARRPYMNALVTFAMAQPRSYAAATPFIRRRHLTARIRQLSEEYSMSRLRIVSALGVLLLFVASSAWLAAATLPLQARELTLLSLPTPPPVSLAALSAPQPPSPGSSGPEQAQQARQNLREQARQNLREAVEQLRERAAAQQRALLPVAVSPPRPTHRVAPEYPLELRTYGVEAVVTLHLVVNVNGHVTDVDVIRTRVVTTTDIDDPAYWTLQPSRLFARAAETAAEQWEFASSNAATTVEIGFMFVPRQATAGFAIGNPGQTRVALPSETPVADASSPGAATTAPANGGVVGSPTPGLVPAAPAPAKTAEPTRLRVGGQVRSPMMAFRVPPQYPDAAKAARVSGVVILELVIGTDGSVSETTILRSIPLLDQAALDAVRQWRYEPTLLNGVPVEVIMTVTVNFTLPPEQ
jgi:TonB family protein